MRSSSSQERKKIASGFKFLYRFLKFTSRSLRGCWGYPILMLIFILVTSGFYEYTAYQVGLISSEFYGALTKKSYTRFLWTVKLSILYVFSISLTIAVRTMVVGHLSVMLRQSMTRRLHRHYFHNRNYYVITNMTDIDNPDQRFTQDVGMVTTTLCAMIPTFLVNPILVVFYTYKCVDKAGWLGPISAYIMFVVFAVLTRLLTTWTSTAVYEQDKQEGNFRYLHTQLRVSGENAAFLDVGQSQEFFATTAFNRLLHALRVSINRSAALLCVTTLSAYVGGILNYLALGIVLFGGLFGNLTTSEITVLISETSFYLLYLINKLTTLIDLANGIAKLVGVGHRLLTLEDRLNDCRYYETPASYCSARLSRVPTISPSSQLKPNWTKSECENVFVRLDHISVGLPMESDHILVHDLSLILRLHEPLCITGPSGTGKTALLRMLSDLWPARPASPQQPNQSYFYRSLQYNQVFVPQKPFVPASVACPPGLFDAIGVLDGAGDDKDESSSAFASNPSTRALHLAYLLLTLSTPVDDLDSPVASLPDSESTVTTMDLENQRSTDGSLLHGSLCGYSIKSFVEAFDLLTEFRLTKPEDIATVRAQLIEFQADKLSSSNISRGRCADCCKAVGEILRYGCGFEKRANRFMTTSWQDFYSPGEMQRLVLASVCHRRPDVAFLDEATSQLNELDAEQAYSSLRQRRITTISVTHHKTICHFHSRELRLTPCQVDTAGAGDLADAAPARKTLGQLPPQWELIDLT